MPKLKTPDGSTIDGDDVERRFAAAMSAPEPDEPPAPAPQPKDGDEGQADAPAPADDGKHRRTRTTKAAGSRGRGGAKRPAKASPAAAAPPTGTYVQPVAEWLQGLTIAAAIVPVPGELGVRLRLQGQVVTDHTPGLARAVDLAACNNQVIRRGVEQLTMGSAGWVLPAVMATVPFAMASAAVWRAPVDERAAAAADAFSGAVREQLAEMAGAGTPA
ncbi:hypothetical protein [Actinomadura sp. NPDC048394]|uniref:hypothetical protein n=1 Tax=Actinomadura sp. NPDC048394 TaxID=3158223 RepID=UPI0033D5BC1F